MTQGLLMSSHRDQAVHDCVSLSDKSEILVVPDIAWAA
jgi:hypothetical protein